MKEVVVWVNEKVAPGAVSPVIASALASLRGELEKACAGFLRESAREADYGRSLDIDHHKQARERINALEESTLSAVVASITADVEAARESIKRAAAIASVSCDHGCAIVLSSRSKELTGHVWLRVVDGGIGIALGVSDKKCKSLGTDKVLEVMTSGAAAYDYVIEHRVQLLGELEVHMSEVDTSVAVVD